MQKITLVFNQKVGLCSSLMFTYISALLTRVTGMSRLKKNVDNGVIFDKFEFKGSKAYFLGK